MDAAIPVLHIRAMLRRVLPILLRTWLVIAAIDATFASCLSVFAYRSTLARVWQGVAATVMGPAALAGGSRAVIIGLLLHVTVAFFWSTVFLVLALGWPTLRATISTVPGILAVALVYGPLVWCVMSFVVIPTATGRPPAITVRWWIQLAGHAVFVALPIVTMVARGLARERPLVVGAAAVGAA